jgi:hypothetical protein
MTVEDFQNCLNSFLQFFDEKNFGRLLPVFVKVVSVFITVMDCLWHGINVELKRTNFKSEFERKKLQKHEFKFENFGGIQNQWL